MLLSQPTAPFPPDHVARDLHVDPHSHESASLTELDRVAPWIRHGSGPSLPPVGTEISSCPAELRSVDGEKAPIATARSSERVPHG